MVDVGVFLFLFCCCFVVLYVHIGYSLPKVIRVMKSLKI